MDTDTDRELVRDFLGRKDETAFRRLYRRHSPALYALSLRLVAGSEADAQDILQETWIRAARALARFAWRSSLSTWLAGIAVRCCWELLSQQRRSHESLREAAPQTEAPTHEDDREQRVDLERAIAALPDGYRAVFVLRDMVGYTHGEIGTLLGIHPGTSKSQLHHARHALREYLGAGRTDP